MLIENLRSVRFENNDVNVKIEREIDQEESMSDNDVNNWYEFAEDKFCGSSHLRCARQCKSLPSPVPIMQKIT